jgi:hypothetical protein
MSRRYVKYLLSLGSGEVDMEYVNLKLLYVFSGGEYLRQWW